MKLSFGQPGYPKQISEGFPGIPGDLDAAILAAANNKMYFFKVQDGNDNVIYIKSVDSGRQLLEIWATEETTRAQEVSKGDIRDFQTKLSYLSRN